MSVLEIDLDSSLTYYDELVQLESLEYLLEFAWSDRESSWYLNIYDQDGNQLATGIKLLLNVDLLRRFNDPRLPPGKLICDVLGGDSVDIGTSADLGERVTVLYVTSDDASLATATSSGSAITNPGVTASLAISPASLSLTNGTSSALSAIESPSGSNVTSSSVWSSNNSAIASVDAAGNVTANSIGVVAITAMYDGVLTAICYVTVTGAI
jgi:hypothetical protein